MPYAAPTVCCRAGCNALGQRGGYCAEHKAEAAHKYRERERVRHREYKARRTDDKFYTTPQWRKFRLWFLASNPLCVICKQKNILTSATVVDHIKPLKTAPGLAFTPGNMRPLCKSCHSRHGAVVRRGGRSESLETAV